MSKDEKRDEKAKDAKPRRRWLDWGGVGERPSTPRPAPPKGIGVNPQPKK
jgi:hypothetical protein